MVYNRQCTTCRGDWTKENKHFPNSYKHFESPVSGMEAVDKRKVLRQRSIDKEKEKAEKRRSLTDSVKKILKKDVENRTDDDKEFLEQNKTIAKKITKNITSREEKEDRKKEWEDDLDVLKAKCLKLAEAIKKSKSFLAGHDSGQ